MPISLPKKLTKSIGPLKISILNCDSNMLISPICTLSIGIFPGGPLRWSNCEVAFVWFKIDYYLYITYNVGNFGAKWAPIPKLDIGPNLFIFNIFLISPLNLPRKVSELVYSALKTVLCLLLGFLFFSFMRCQSVHSLTRVIPFIYRFTIGTYPLNLWVTNDFSYGKGRGNMVGSK